MGIPVTRLHGSNRSAGAVVLCVALTAVLSSAFSGCGLARQEEIAFIPSNYALSGVVLRAGTTVPGETVKLYDQFETVLLDSIVTDPTGQYGFDFAPAGGVMVKVSSLAPGDFRYVRYILVRTSASDHDSVPPLDLSAYGCRALQPDRGAQVQGPDPGRPLEFRWMPMNLRGTPRYRVRIADASDSLVWESSRDTHTQATFNGIGTGGVFAGTIVGSGAYFWRIKVRLANDVSAATESWPITFLPPSENGTGPMKLRRGTGGAS